MPLLDHFHEPLASRRHWESFHALWAAEIVRSLNRSSLPSDYFAEAQVHVGSRVEVDVGSFEHENGMTGESVQDSGGLALATWAPPTTSLVMPLVFPDEIEVQVFSTDTGATLVAAIEFVSPGNKDRPETRRAFVAMCASYLHAGIGLVVVDVVTKYHANLHDELIRFLEQEDRFRFPETSGIYAVAYRPRRLQTSDQSEIWRHPLSLGEKLPTLPLALRRGPTLPLDLNTSYEQVRQDSRL